MTVLGKRHLMQHDESYRVNAEQTYQIIRVDDIALGLGHFRVACQQPRVAEDLFGQRLIQRH